MLGVLCNTLPHANVCEYDKFCGDWTCPDLKNVNCFYSCHALSWCSSYSGVVVFPDVKFLSIGEGKAYSLEVPLTVVFWGSSFALDYIANFRPCFFRMLNVFIKSKSGLDPKRGERDLWTV